MIVFLAGSSISAENFWCSDRVAIGFMLISLTQSLGRVTEIYSTECIFVLPHLVKPGGRLIWLKASN